VTWPVEDPVQSGGPGFHVRINRAEKLGGEPILAKLTHTPGNNAPIGGLKVVAENGWFAARPSGTEKVYKLYAESFRGKEHLREVQEEAQEIVDKAFKVAGV